MTEIRAKHAEGGKWFGVEAKEGKVKDMYKENVFEPLSVKEQIVKSATEAACMILRIDDVIAAGKDERVRLGPPGGAEAWGRAKAKRVSTRIEQSKGQVMVNEFARRSSGD